MVFCPRDAQYCMSDFCHSGTCFTTQDDTLERCMNCTALVERNHILCDDCREDARDDEEDQQWADEQFENERKETK